MKPSLASNQELSDLPVGSRTRARVKISLCARWARLRAQMLGQLTMEVLHGGNASDVTAICCDGLSKADGSE